jgi:hypothetical protein
MSIISSKQINQSSATAKLNGKKSVRTHVQVYRVKTNSPTDTSYMIQSSFPAIGTQHPNDTAAYLTGCDPQRHDKSKMVWLVTLTYSTERQRDTNPANDPVDIEWDTDIAVEPFLFDRDGNPMLNSAGDHYGEAIKGEKSTWTVVCTSNQTQIPSWIDGYKNAVNSDSCTIDGVTFDPGQCKIKKLHISRWQNRGTYRYRVLSITIKITDNPTVNTKDGLTQVDGWSRNVIDEGLHCLEDSVFPDETLTLNGPCFDDNGNIVHKAAALDGTGYQLFGDMTKKSGPPTSDQIVYNSFNLYNAKPFNSLPLN